MDDHFPHEFMGSGPWMTIFHMNSHGLAKKPTTFLTLRLPTIDRYLHSRRGGYYDLPRIQTLYGKNSDGGWNTSAAKEYPPSLCLAIARSIKDAIDGIERPPVPCDQ